MRYLGKVHSSVQGNQHLRTLLERDAFVRAAKHLINAELREVNDGQVAKVLAHLFNLLLAPQVMIKKLDEGELKWPAAPVVAAPEEPRQQVEETPEETKKKGKKQKKKEDKKASAVVEEVQPFAVDGLFIDMQVFKGLLPIEEPGVLSLKPSEFYARLRIVARQRYGMELPEKQSDIRCLQQGVTKLAVLRDLCLKVGVKLIANSNREYVLDNDLKSVLASAMQSNSAQSGGKKKTVVSSQPVTQASDLTYENLPFKPSDFAEVFPVIKHLEL
jgi:hypothetical protein